MYWMAHANAMNQVKKLAVAPTGACFRSAIMMANGKILSNVIFAKIISVIQSVIRQNQRSAMAIMSKPAAKMGNGKRKRVSLDVIHQRERATRANPAASNVMAIHLKHVVKMANGEIQDNRAVMDAIMKRAHAIPSVPPVPSNVMTAFSKHAII